VKTKRTIKKLEASLSRFSDDFMAERNQPPLQERASLQKEQQKWESWKSVRLGDSLKLINGRAFKPSEWRESGVPIVRIQNLNNPDAPFNYYDGELPDKFLLNTGDLLFAWSGTPGTSFGAHIWRGKKAWLNQHIFKVVFDESEFDKRFLQLAINQNLNEYIRQAHGGAGLAHITKGKFENSELSQPSLDIQQEIVAEIEKQFSRLDEAVAGLKRVKANLKRYKAAVLKAAVEGKLTGEWRRKNVGAGPCACPDSDAGKCQGKGQPQGIAPTKDRKYESGKDLLKRILVERKKKWEEKNPGKKYKEPAAPDTWNLPELPDGWVYTNIEQLIRADRDAIKTGPFGSLLKKHEHQSHGVPVLGIENIEAMKFQQGSKIHITEKKAAQLEGYRVRASDILISRSGTVGEICVVPDDIGEARISTNLMKISLSPKGMLPHFFTFLFNGSPFVLNQATEYCKGSTRAFLNQDILKRLIFALPPMAEQEIIIEEISRQFSLVDGVETELERNTARAERLRQSILSKAFGNNCHGKKT